MTFDPTKYGATPVSQSGGFDPTKYGATAVHQPTPQPSTPSLADSLWSSLSSYGSNIANTVQGAGDAVHQAFTDPNKNPVSQGFDVSVEAAKGIGSTAASLIPGAQTALGAVGGVAKKGIDFAGNISDNLDTGAVKLGIMNPQAQAQNQQDASQFANSPVGTAVQNTADVGQGAGVIAGTILGAKGVSSASDSAVNAISDTAKTLKGVQYVADTLPKVEPPLPPVNETKITDLYNRAIKPTVAGKSSAGQMASAQGKAITGLQAIADNKPNLSFTNAEGETISGATPKTVDQLSQGIAQTKTNIFKEYDALAKQAGESGVVVDAPKVASELDSVINSKSLELANPSAVAYAKEVRARFNEAGPIDAQTAQDVIQHYNESLKAFYSNPGYDTASKAGIDALIANKLREQLDAGITGATGEQYQALKSQYGALASIEKDVAHRALVWGRQNNVGLAGSLANVTSGAELVRGLITMNPADIAISGAIKGIQKYNQYLNNPDVGVTKIFFELEKSSRPSTRSMSGLEAPGK